MTAKAASPAWYVGAPGHGKTTAAIAHAQTAARARGVPLLVVDSVGASNAAGLREVRPGVELVNAVWPAKGDRESVRVVPRDRREAEHVFAVVAAGGSLELVVDEASLWLDRTGRGELVRLMRTYRHAQVGVRLTTQHLTGDVPQAALSLAPDVYLFRCTAWRTVELAEREWGVDRAQLSALPPHRWIRVRLGAPGSR